MLLLNTCTWNKMQSLRCDILHAFSLSMCMQKNIYEWVRDHCLHHKYVCTDADPHNASRGFFFSHIGWLLVQEHPDCAEKKQKLSLSDLTTDKVVMFQKRWANLNADTDLDHKKHTVMQDSFNQQQATECNNAPHTLLVVQLISFQAP